MEITESKSGKLLKVSSSVTHKIECLVQGSHFIICTWIHARISGSSQREGPGLEEIKVARSKISSLLFAGTPLSLVHLLALDVHTFLPCQHMLGVRSTLIEILDPNWTNFLIALRQHLRVWLLQKITPMDASGAPGCTSWLPVSRGHNYLIRCRLPSLVAEELALVYCITGVGRGEKRRGPGTHAFFKCIP